MLRCIIFAVHFLCVLTLGAQQTQTAYFRDFDYSGAVDTNGLYRVQQLASAIADSLSDVYTKEVSVVDGGQYFLSNLFEENPTDLFDARFETLKQGRDGLLYIGKIIDHEGGYVYYTRVHLSSHPLFSCLGDVAAASMQSYINAAMNDAGHFAVNDGIYAGLREFQERVEYLTGCCFQSENKSLKNQCSACDLDESYAGGAIAEFHNMIINHGDTSSIGKFMYLENTILSFPTGIEQFRSVDLAENSIDVPDLLATLESHPSAGSWNLFDELEAVKAQAENFGLGDRVRVNILYIDESNCSDLNSFLSASPIVNSSVFMSGSDESCIADDPLVCEGGECMLYDEQLIILNIDGELRAYSKIVSPWPEGIDVVGESLYAGSENKSLIIPALIIREVLKRLAMGVMNVFIDAGITITIEKVFGSPADCQTGEDLWSDAWARYKIAEFSNKRYAVWKFIIVFAEGAIGGNIVFDIISGGIQSSLKYLITGQENLVSVDTTIGSININGPPGNSKTASNFKLSVFFTKFAVGAASSAVGPVAGWSKDAAKKVIEKLRTESTEIADRVLRQSIEDLIVEVQEDLTTTGGRLIWRLIKDPDLVTAWKGAYVNGVSRLYRSDPGYLLVILRHPFGTSKANFLDNAQPGDFSQIYRGELISVPTDDNVDYLTAIYGQGRKMVKFSTDPVGKEFDLVTSRYLVEGKKFSTLGILTEQSSNAKSFRLQFEASINTGRKAIVDIEGDIDGNYVQVFESLVSLHPGVEYRLIQNGNIISSNF